VRVRHSEEASIVTGVGPTLGENSTDG